MTPEAEIVDTKFCKALRWAWLERFGLSDLCQAIIKSRAALAYAEAQARIDDPKAGACGSSWGETPST